MSAAIKIIPRDERPEPPAQRLKVKAVYDHRTVLYEGDIFSFLQKLMDEGWTGKGTFHVNQGRDFYGFEFDLRTKSQDINRSARSRD